MGGWFIHKKGPIPKIKSGIGTVHRKMLGGSLDLSYLLGLDGFFMYSEDATMMLHWPEIGCSFSLAIRNGPRVCIQRCSDAAYYYGTVLPGLQAA